MTAFLGGMQPIAVGWDGVNSAYVDFVSTYANKLYQLYCGRRLIGVTTHRDARRVSGQVVPTRSPAPLTLVAVDAQERNTNFGPSLPRSPWNVYIANWSAASYPVDAKRFLVEVGAAPDADPETLVAYVPFVGDGNYSRELPAFDASGAWKFRVTALDGTKPNGNAGTAAIGTIQATVHAPDLILDGNGQRFATAKDGTDVVLSWQLP